MSKNHHTEDSLTAAASPAASSDSVQGGDYGIDSTESSKTEGVTTAPLADDNSNPDATYAPVATPQERHAALLARISTLTPAERTEFSELAKTYGGEIDVTVDHNGTPGLNPDGTPILLNPDRAGERVAEAEAAKQAKAQKDGKPYTNFATGQTIENAPVDKKTANANA